MRGSALALLLTGCAPAIPSVEEFRRDPAAAERMVAQCAGGRRHGQVCDNAAEALAKARREERVKVFRKGFE